MTLDGKFCLICEKRRGVERESEGVKEREKRERERERKRKRGTSFRMAVLQDQ